MACEAACQLKVTGELTVPPSGELSCALALPQLCDGATVKVRGVEKRVGQLAKRAPTYQLTAPAESGTLAPVEVVEAMIDGALLPVEAQTS